MTAREPTTRTRQVLHLILGAGAIQASTIAVFIFLARVLPQADFGTWRQLFLVHQIALALIFSAMPMSLLRFSGRHDEAGRFAVIRQHLWLTLGAGVLVVAVVALAADSMAVLLGNVELGGLLHLFAPQTAAAMLTSLAAPAFVALSRTWWSTCFSLFLALVCSVPVLLAAFLGMNLKQLVLTSMMSASSAGILAVLVLLRVTSTSKRRVNGRIAPAPNREVLIFLWPLLLAAGIGLVGQRMDHIIVGNQLGPDLYAIYAVGAFEIPLFSLLQSSVSSVMLPQFSALAQDRNWTAIASLWRSALIRSAVIVYPIVASLIVLADDFVVVLFGEKFKDAAPVFQVYLLLAPIRIMTFGLVLRAAGQTMPDLQGAVGYLVAVTALGLLGVSMLGALGAVSAVVICTVGLAAFLARRTQIFTSGAISMCAMYPPIMVGAFIATVVVFYFGYRAAFSYWTIGSWPRLFIGGLTSSVFVLAGMFCLRKLRLRAAHI